VSCFKRHEPNEEPQPQHVDVRTLQTRIDKLIALASEHNCVVTTGSDGTERLCERDQLRIAVFTNDFCIGDQLAPRLCASASARAFVNNIYDGCLPSELKDEHTGVNLGFQSVDNSSLTCDEMHDWTGCLRFA
jgi:hypothetical protein